MATYRFVIEASKDGKDWKMVAELVEPVVLPSDPIPIFDYNFIRYRVIEEVSII